MVHIIGPQGEELAPTHKYDYVYKKLLKREAIVINKNPFTIKILKYGLVRAHADEPTKARKPIDISKEKLDDEQKNIARCYIGYTWKHSRSDSRQYPR